MSFSDKESSEAVECLVDSLTMDGSTLSDGNLVLGSTEFEQLTDLSQNLNMSSDMEVQVVPVGSEDELQTSHEEQVEEEYVQEDMVGAHEIEIQTEPIPTEECIVPETKVVKSSVPPLRPLTIAPKPAKAVPIQIKPATGTQLLVLQGGALGQQFKVLSQTGQELNLSNVSIGKPITIKPAVKTITTSQGGLSVIQPKQMFMKKVLTQVSKSPKDNKQGHVLVMQKNDSSQVKLVQSSVLSGTTKTITVAQAQQMGYLTGTKIVPQMSGSKSTLMIKGQASKNIKLVSQVKSPTKILPAPQSSSGKLPQRIYIKPSNTPILSSGQLIQPIGSAGQLHQINIPGKGVQYIKFIQAPQVEASPTSTANIANSTIKTHSSGVGNKLIPVSTISSPTKMSSGVMLTDVKKISKSNLIAPKPGKIAIPPSSSSSGQMLVLPSNFSSGQATTSKASIPVRSVTKPLTPSDFTSHERETSNLESNGIRPRKPCNCTKSQCLKLYCDCFANGEFCYMCNCMNCYNNLDNEEHRQRAIKNCLERNPNAFRPKIGKAKDITGEQAIRKHTKGCNCKRSGCLKNYCECYEAKIACSSNCKCIGCRNVEDTLDKKNIKTSPSTENSGMNQQPLTPYSMGNDGMIPMRPKKSTQNKQAFNYITTQVIEATTQCLLSLVTEDMIEDEEAKQGEILEEFGRCLEEIINCSIQSSKTNSIVNN